MSVKIECNAGIETHDCFLSHPPPLVHLWHSCTVVLILDFSLAGLSKRLRNVSLPEIGYSGKLKWSVGKICKALHKSQFYALIKHRTSWSGAGILKIYSSVCINPLLRGLLVGTWFLDIGAIQFVYLWAYKMKLSSSCEELP